MRLTHNWHFGIVFPFSMAYNEMDNWKIEYWQISVSICTLGSLRVDSPWAHELMSLLWACYELFWAYRSLAGCWSLPNPSPHRKSPMGLCPSSYDLNQISVSIMINYRVNFNNDNSTIDPDGRFIIINTPIYNIGFCIASIYGPNAEGPTFRQTFSSLSLHGHTTLIAGEDINLINIRFLLLVYPENKVQCPY